MPSPIGHALAGAVLAWTFNRRDLTPGSDPGVRSRGQIPGSDPGVGSRTATWVCVALAMAPDLDLLAPYTHRTITHSLVAVAVVAIVAAGVTGKVTGRMVWHTILLCTAAYASHLLLDWLAEDYTPPRGLQLLWPFSDRWFISEWDLFRGTARRPVFSISSMRINALAIAQEIATLGPVAALAWLVRVKAAARLPAEMARRHHAAE